MIENSRLIYKNIIDQFNPQKIFVAFSGGDDSLTALHVALELGIKPIALHINTGTGVEETTLFCREEAKRLNLEYIEATNYEEYKMRVIKNGFYGCGASAHRFAYNILKDKPFRRVIGSYRRGKRNYKVFVISGVRKQESKKRASVKDYDVRGSDIWINLINNWSKEQTLDYLKLKGVERNPVAVQLCRSGECNCGTPITPKRANFELAELKVLYPKCYNEIMNLQDQVLKAGHCYGWGQNKPKFLIAEQRGQKSLFKNEEIPMCQSCSLR